MATNTENKTYLAMVDDCQLEKREDGRIIHKSEAFYSIIDIVRALAKTTNANRYWTDLKRDLREKEGFPEVYDKIVSLRLPTSGGPQATECANIKTLLRIVQSIKSSKAEPFKSDREKRLAWFAQEMLDLAKDGTDIDSETITACAERAGLIHYFECTEDNQDEWPLECEEGDQMWQQTRDLPAGVIKLQAPFDDPCKEVGVDYDNAATDSVHGGKLTFETWIIAVEDLLKKHEARFGRHANPYTLPLSDSTGHDVWIESYNNGFSPEEALSEDMRHWAD